MDEFSHLSTQFITDTVVLSWHQIHNVKQLIHTILKQQVATTNQKGEPNLKTPETNISYHIND